LSDHLSDSDAWNKYPKHRWIFNKLELSLKLGYNAGPAGTSVPCQGDYIVRPTYNLSGMGVNARRVNIKPGDYITVKPGEFWCDFFHGPNITIDYSWDTVDDRKVLRPVFAAQGYRTNPDLYRFAAWRRIEPPYWKLPSWISSLQNVPRFNIEFIHDKIIEIHLRPGIDFPDNSKEIIPVWDDMSEKDCDMFITRGYTFIPNFDDADGHLPSKRLGFLYK